MKILIIILIGVLTSLSTKAQNKYTLNNETSTVIIKGTSSLHDWEINAESIGGALTLALKDGVKIEGISEIIITIDVESIKSGKGAMNKKIYSAFDSDMHPKIVFSLSEITQVKEDSISAKGVLKMAGTEQTIDLVVSYQFLDDLSLKITGSKALLMSDYGIQPPKAMLGTLKTGNEVEVFFDIVFIQNQ